MMTSERHDGIPAGMGRIFDVRRFSTHDGGGIRTTVFLKGCPLRCVWCHNPEGISPRRRPVWLAGRCIGCGCCVKACQSAGVVSGKAGLRIKPEAQEDWDALMEACPTQALRWDSRDVDVDSLMAELRRDGTFFAHGGGVTLSGGDPLMQGDFSAELMRRCRAEGIHTAIETELFAAPEVVERVLACADLIYVDLKLMDSDLHRRWTGVDNGRILENLKMLLRGPMAQRVTMRTPLIPGITATEENIAAIASFLQALYPQVRYELLNYNPLASAKYPLSGREFVLDPALPRYDAQSMEAWRQIARTNGLCNVIAE